MSQGPVTGAASSGIAVEKKTLKALMRRSDAKPLAWCGAIVVVLFVSGYLYWNSLDSWWVILTCLFYSSVLSTALYALSHECAHGTAFRTRWLNETVFWLTSLWYFEEPYQRRYTHASHHSYTWINGKDAQMPMAPRPFTLWGWFIEATGILFVWFECKSLVRNALGFLSEDLKRCTPESEWPKLKWNARAFIAIYLGGAGVSILLGWTWPLILVVLPRLIGNPVMSLFILIQHAEMAENQANILNSTRSFDTNPFLRLIYFNMNFHIEHHLYPTVPFYSLPHLNRVIKDQLPAPDPGFWLTNWEVFRVALKRSLGGTGKTVAIRQTIV